MAAALSRCLVLALIACGRTPPRDLGVRIEDWKPAAEAVCGTLGAPLSEPHYFGHDPEWRCHLVPELVAGDPRRCRARVAAFARRRELPLVDVSLRVDLDDGCAIRLPEVAAGLFAPFVPGGVARIRRELATLARWHETRRPMSARFAIGDQQISIAIDAVSLKLTIEPASAGG